MKNELKSDSSKASTGIVSCVLIAVLTLASGAVAGVFNNRWGPRADLAAAGQRIDQLPGTLGDWESQSAEPVDKGAAQMLQCAGSTVRTYQNRQTGALVRMVLIVGPPGPTAVHTPDVCYTSGNYEMEGKPQEVDLRAGGHAAGFWSASFRARSLRGENLRVFYSWNDGSGWRASRHPRIEYAASPLLYKLQVVTGALEADEEGEAWRGFLDQLLPSLEKLLEKEASS